MTMVDWSDLLAFHHFCSSFPWGSFLLLLLRSALEQKKADEIKEFGPIEYDAPVESEKKTIGLGTKVKANVIV